MLSYFNPRYNLPVDEILPCIKSSNAIANEQLTDEYDYYKYRDFDRPTPLPMITSNRDKISMIVGHIS